MKTECCRHGVSVSALAGYWDFAQQVDKGRRNLGGEDLRLYVAALVERCRELGLPRVFAFTLAAPFFARCGFSEFQRDDMPAIVWVECSKCPKFYCCDEIGMLLYL